MMRKLSPELECPVDNVFYYAVEHIAPIVHDMGLTPNMLTGISLLFGIGAAGFALNYAFELSALFYAVSYLFDCLDGYVARKYNIVSKFGDKFDHISDSVKVAVLILALCFVNWKLFLLVLPILVYVNLVLYFHMAYQEMYYDNPEDSDSLASLNWVLHIYTPRKKDVAQTLKYTRHFGCGTKTLVIVFILFIYSQFYCAHNNPS